MCLSKLQHLVLYQLRVVCPFFTIGNNSRTIFSPTNACSPTEPLDVYASSQPAPARAELASLYDGQIGQRLLLSTTGAAEELVPTWDTQCVHPPTHLAGRALQPVFMLHRCILLCLHS